MSAIGIEYSVREDLSNRTEYYNFMKLALGLASKGKGLTSPNPMVGAVIVKNKKIIGKGFHSKSGFSHAEIIALESAKEKANGSTLFINLEPCVHFGKTPPCCDEVIKSGIKKVVIGMKDPNPLVNGKGINKLRRRGIEVEVGIMEKEARELNEAFIKSIKTKMPFVIMKSAMSLDGRIATKSGNSKWITGEESRRFVQKLRAEVDGIMVGIGTVLKDDPRLTLRTEKTERNFPAKIVVDSSLKIPITAKLFSSKPEVKVIIATTNKASRRKIESLRKTGVEVIQTEADKGKVNLKKLMKELYKKGIISILLEGGSELNASAIKKGIVDKVFCFYAPILLGGKDAKGFIGGEGVDRIQDAKKIDVREVKRVGKDVLVVGYIRK